MFLALLGFIKHTFCLHKTNEEFLKCFNTPPSSSPAHRYTFASGSADNIKQWMFPDGSFIQNLSGHNAIINTLAVNSDGVLVSGGIHHEPHTKTSSTYVIIDRFFFIWVQNASDYSIRLKTHNDDDDALFGFLRS